MLLRWYVSRAIIPIEYKSDINQSYDILGLIIISSFYGDSYTPYSIETIGSAKTNIFPFIYKLLELIF